MVNCMSLYPGAQMKIELKLRMNVVMDLNGIYVHNIVWKKIPIWPRVSYSLIITIPLPFHYTYHHKNAQGVGPLSGPAPVLYRNNRTDKFQRIELKLRPESNAEEIFHIRTYTHEHTHIHILISGSGSHKTWTFSVPLPQVIFQKIWSGFIPIFQNLRNPL